MKNSRKPGTRRIQARPLAIASDAVSRFGQHGAGRAARFIARLAILPCSSPAQRNAIIAGAILLTPAFLESRCARNVAAPNLKSLYDPLTSRTRYDIMILKDKGNISKDRETEK